MDFLDPKKRRAHQKRLYVGYALYTILVGVITVLLVLFAKGYGFNPRTGDFTQNGLLFVNAHLEPARVTLNGQVKGTTDQRLVLPAGNYKVELNREGYRPWQREFVLEGGRIERLLYPFLFPEQLRAQDIQLYAKRPAFASQSPNQRWLIIQKSGSLHSYDMVDLNNAVGGAPQIELPNDLFSDKEKGGSLELVEWSDDNRRFLVRRTYSGGVEYVLIDRERPTESRNLTKTINTSFTDIRLRDKKYDRYYLYDAKAQALKTAQLRGDEPRTVLSKVLQFQVHSDNVILYITSDGAAEGSVRVNVREGEQIFTLREFASTGPYLLDLSRYNDKWYMVAGAVVEQKTYVFRDPVGFLKRNSKTPLLPVATLRLDKAQYALFSRNSRFVAVQAAQQFVVYDAETDRIYRYDTKLPLQSKQKAVWMDGHRLTLVSEGTLVVFDYDGINQQPLSATYPTFEPFFTENYEALYTIGPSAQVKGRAAIIRSRLLAAPISN